MAEAAGIRFVRPAHRRPGPISIRSGDRGATSGGDEVRARIHAAEARYTGSKYFSSATDRINVRAVGNLAQLGAHRLYRPEIWHFTFAGRNSSGDPKCRGFSRTFAGDGQTVGHRSNEWAFRITSATRET